MERTQGASDEYVLDQLSTCEAKLMKLMKDLEGHDLNSVLKQMKEEGYDPSQANQLPQYNTRIRLPTTQRNVYEDEEDSGEDDENVMDREKMKKLAQRFVDSKTKRRTTKKKKK